MDRFPILYDSQRQRAYRLPIQTDQLSIRIGLFRIHTDPLVVDTDFSLRHMNRFAIHITRRAIQTSPQASKQSRIITQRLVAP
jgi:hypothetical protein